MIGTVVGSYRISSKLSIGGMGTVYRAEHVLIGKSAAVKILHPELSANQEIVNRFFLEAKATTTIKHPGIVDIFDFGYMESGHAYLVMEFLDGISMARRIKLTGGGKIHESEAALLLRGICNALAAAHDAGIVHRDLKPDNIMIVPDADAPLGLRAKILDFGIAKLTDIGLAGTSTKTGAVMGTPTYMSPEQCSGKGQVDLRADLYSIGCIFYELVTGRPPFTDLGAGELIGAHLYIAPAPPTKFEPRLSPDTNALIMALLAKNPAKRPQSAKELSQRLLLIAQQGGLSLDVSSRQSEPVLPPLQFESTEGMTPLDDLDIALPPLPSSIMSDPIQMTTLDTPAPVHPDRPSHPVDKPTTLSSAASSVLDYRAKSRKGLVIGGAAAAALVAVALVIVLGGSTTKEVIPTKQPMAAPMIAPLPRPPPIEPPPLTETAAPTPPTPKTPVETATPIEPPPVDDPTPTPVVTKHVKKPVAKPPVQKKPVKQPTNSLIETDLD